VAPSEGEAAVAFFEQHYQGSSVNSKCILVARPEGTVRAFTVTRQRAPYTVTEVAT
jgi:hypothetical protein